MSLLSKIIIPFNDLILYLFFPSKMSGFFGQQEKFLQDQGKFRYNIKALQV